MMTCGIICRREVDDIPLPPRRTRCEPEELDWVYRALVGIVAVGAIVASVIILGLLTYGIITTIIAVL